MKNFILIILLSFTLSGCFVWRAYKNFSVNMGKHLPVKEGVNRCDENMLCFDEKNKAMQKKPPALHSKPPVPHQKPNDDKPKTLKGNDDVPTWMKQEAGQ